MIAIFLSPYSPLYDESILYHKRPDACLPKVDQVGPSQPRPTEYMKRVEQPDGNEE